MYCGGYLRFCKRRYCLKKFFASFFAANNRPPLTQLKNDCFFMLFVNKQGRYMVHLKIKHARAYSVEGGGSKPVNKTSTRKIAKYD